MVNKFQVIIYGQGRALTIIPKWL